MSETEEPEEIENHVPTLPELMSQLPALQERGEENEQRLINIEKTVTKNNELLRWIVKNQKKK